MTERGTPSLDGLVIAILGGTGEQGRGLARRFAMAGHQVIIGSRNHDRAHGVARPIGRGAPDAPTWIRPLRAGPRGVRRIYAGPLLTCGQTEPLPATRASITRRYRAPARWRTTDI